MIPKIIHQVWIGDFEIPTREQGLMTDIQDLHKDYEYMFWTSEKVNEELKFPREIQEIYDFFYNRKDFVFCADIVRLFATHEYGGFYFDVDWSIKNRLDDFLTYDNVFFFHNKDDHTIPNNIFFTKKQSEILNFCLSKINIKNSWYGPSWLRLTVKEYFNFEYQVDPEEVQKKLREINSEFYAYPEFEQNFGRHLSLYSWSPENRKNFADGNINYLE